HVRRGRPRRDPVGVLAHERPVVAQQQRLQVAHAARGRVLVVQHLHPGQVHAPPAGLPQAGRGIGIPAGGKGGGGAGGKRGGGGGGGSRFRIKKIGNRLQTHFLPLFSLSVGRDRDAARPGGRGARHGVANPGFLRARRPFSP